MPDSTELPSVAPLERTDPAQVGGLRLVGRLGSGGMGVVYLARQASGDLVALKVIRPELTADPEFRARFTSEVRHALSVTGPYLAEVREASTSGSPQFVATAYVPGENLGHCVLRRGRLDDDEIAALAVALADSLGRLHQARVVHRDVKPSNIQLGPQGPILLDLGVSRSLDAASLTRTSATPGTPGWMPPEQWTGGTSGPAGDMWSWGAVVAFSAGGEHPFGRGSGEAIAYRIVHEPASIPDLPQPLAGLVARALDKDAARRPSAQEVLSVMAVGPDGAASFVGQRWTRIGLLASRHDQSAHAVALGTVADEQTTAALGPTRLEPITPEAPAHRRGLVLAIAAASLALVGGLALTTLARGGGVETSHPTPTVSSTSMPSAPTPSPSAAPRPLPAAAPPVDVSKVASSGVPAGAGNGKAKGRIKAGPAKHPGKAKGHSR